MAAYAALCSLMHIVEHIQHHPSPPISLDQQQTQSLSKKVTFLQEFLEGYSNVGCYSKEADPLEARIADAAHAAEDVIESHIVDQLHDRYDFLSRCDSRIPPRRPIPDQIPDQKTRFFDFSKRFGGPRARKAAQLYQSLQKVIKDMNSIKKKVMKIKEKRGAQDHLHTPANSLRPSSVVQDPMVGFDDALLEIMDKLTRGQPDRQVIPIVGMGGMGKTTLARNVYVNPLIEQYFDICAWATISQEYDTQEILREVLCPGNREGVRNDTENELGEKLHKHLSGMRYLIVLDDMWSIEAWDDIKRFFPDNKNGSSIVITTRLSNLAFQLSNSYCLEMKFLDEDESWDLLCKTVFGEEGCPLELEEIGKKIVENCRGLPLSIVVTGGLLMKSEHTFEYWEYIAENLNSLLNLEDNERCLKVLYMSYKQLPVYLKPCFLYMGVFREDSMIRVSKLIRLWVAEGFLKPVGGKSLEEIAEECLEELTGRNLVHASRHFGKLKHCSIHDLLRDLCLREAQKERFYSVTKENSFDDTKCVERRVVVPKSKFKTKILDGLGLMSLTRSLICVDGVAPLSVNFRLLRILNSWDYNDCVDDEIQFYDWCLLKNMFYLVNSRYFSIMVDDDSNFPSSVCLLWNLQTLTVDCGGLFTAPAEIWSMPQLRHVKFVKGLYLPDHPREDDDIVLSNLHSLSTIMDFKWSEEVIKRIPNLKKLGLCYSNAGGRSEYCLNNLDRLHKLESFSCISYLSLELTVTNFLHKLSFPHSLKKLTLKAYNFYWNEMMEKIGSLPLLEVLKLGEGSFEGSVWETVEGQFRNLKFLKIERLKDLEYWNSESTHFPRLERLVLEYIDELKEIPSGIGEVPTLQTIELKSCSDFAAISAKNILEEQEEFGDVTLQVRVLLPHWKKNEALESLASLNFQVQYFSY